MTPRLRTRLWVDAYLHRLGQENLPAYILHKGDPSSGAVIVKVATLDGNAVCYHRSFDLTTGERAWVALTDGDEPRVDESIAKQRGFDRDLWVIEVESRDGRHLLDDDIGA